MRVLSVNAGADTGGQSIRMKRAFDHCSTWPYRSLIRSANYIRYPMDARWTPRELRSLADEADALHLHNSFRTLSVLPGAGADKGLVIHHHGSGFRAHSTALLREARQRRAVALVSTLDLWALAPDDTEWLPTPYDLAWLQQIRQEQYRPHEGLIIAHAPTDRTAKGTEALIAAVERLRQTYPVQLLLIERRTWAQTLALKATADIFVDQLLLGHGNNAIEAMGMGIPVISGVDVEAGERLQPRHPQLRVPPQTTDAMIEHWGELPYYHATQDTIEQAIEQMVTDPSLRETYAARGRSHVERFHTNQVVVPRLERIYERSLELQRAQVHPVPQLSSLPDVVYVVRSGERNDELRYSLRSLANLPHGRVWIAGYMPKWVTGVGHIPSPTRPGSHIQTKANLQAACEHPEVSESFVYMNDDFFVMHPVQQLPVMHRGPLAEAIRTAGMASAYTRAMRQTLEILAAKGIDDPLMYDLHAPMLVTKAGMLKALALCSYPMVHERTLFGNLQQLGGEQRHNHKVHRQDRGWSAWPFLSTNDHSFRSLPVGEYIRGRFPEQSPYESDAPPASGAAPYRVPRRPIRRHASSTIRRVRVA